MSLVLCILAFLVTGWLARKSLVWGLASMLAVGYAYGILRANLAEMMAHFIFDGAVIGLYLGRLLALRRPDTVANTVLVRPWLLALIGWPVLLALLPIQDPLVQLVGLRANVFLLPMVLIGAQMLPSERRQLALHVAVLNVVAFGFALAEFALGVELFYPRNNVTELIFRSDVGDAAGSLRIPSIFTSSAAYGGVMVCSLPLLAEAWHVRSFIGVRRYMIVGAIVAAVLGVYMAASRTTAVTLFILFFVGTLSLRMRPSRIGVWLAIIAVTGWIVSTDPRLQRFTTLGDTDYVARRISGSVNESFIVALTDYPMGNGIGAGGTSIPYFLQDRLREYLVIENEYARLQLELGLPGLALWLSFIVWIVASGLRNTVASKQLGQRLALTLSIVGFLGASTGTGLLASIPGTALFLMFVGWTVREERHDVPSREVSIVPGSPTPGHASIRQDGPVVGSSIS